MRRGNFGSYNEWTFEQLIQGVERHDFQARRELASRLAAMSLARAVDDAQSQLRSEVLEVISQLDEMKLMPKLADRLRKAIQASEPGGR